MAKKTPTLTQWRRTAQRTTPTENPVMIPPTTVDQLCVSSVLTQLSPTAVFNVHIVALFFTQGVCQ